MNKDYFKKSFSLLEMLVYVAVLVVIIAVATSFLFWTVRSSHKARVVREVADSGQRAAEFIAASIRASKGVYGPTSVFNNDVGQLSLETTDFLPAGEEETYIDFYLCGTRLCFKKESQNPIALTSDQVRVTKLAFSQIATTSPTIQVDIEVIFDSQGSRPEDQATFEIKTSASPRNN